MTSEDASGAAGKPQPQGLRRANTDPKSEAVTMGKKTQHKTNRSTWNLFALIIVLLVGCSQVNDLPLTPEAAFGLPDVPRNARTFMRTFVVKAMMRDAMRAADEALAAINFTERPDGSTNERRCGHRVIGWYDWAVWGCFYFAPGSESEQSRAA